MLDTSTVGIVSVPKKVGFGSISPRAFRRRIVRYWLHPLGVEQSSFEKPPQECVIYTVVYGCKVLTSETLDATLFHITLALQYGGNRVRLRNVLMIQATRRCC